MSNWKRRTAPAILLLSLSGCASTISSCPPLVEYSNGEQDQAAVETGNATALGFVLLPRMMGDYMILRDQVRACRE